MFASSNVQTTLLPAHKFGGERGEGGSEKEGGRGGDALGGFLAILQDNL